MTRREFFENITLLLTFLIFKEDLNLEENNEQLHEAMFWRRVEDG